MASTNAKPSSRRKCAQACTLCRRRKERCDGLLPCGRCSSRNAVLQCFYAHTQSHLHGLVDESAGPILYIAEQVQSNDDGDETAYLDTCTSEATSQVPNRITETTSTNEVVADTTDMSRLLRDAKGTFMFIGDSANLSFLQTIRKVIKDAIGPCSFSEDPLQGQMVETVPEHPSRWIQAALNQTLPSISLDQAKYLIHCYTLAASCVLDLYDEASLLENLPAWLAGPRDETDLLSPTYYIILSLGAQTCPEAQDELAQIFFNFGRYFAAVSLTDNLSISTVQVYCLITMYLLNDSRRNAAFMNLGTAVRAAYALGLHRKEVAKLCNLEEFRTRERLWKVLRILDLFMSASLGRPPATSETRDTRSLDNYSASADLCSIFEAILLDVYSARMVTTETLGKISQRHREWTANFQRGLDVDGIQSTPLPNDANVPNLGFIHLKEAYYWTIMLLTRPFLVEVVSSYVSSSSPEPIDGNRNGASTRSVRLLFQACVDSAIRTIELLQVLLRWDELPKRLPFVINSIFVSALVLGLAHFGDLQRTFPLDENLRLAHRLLAKFPHDAIARRNMAIVEHLIEACRLVNEKRDRMRWEQRRQLVTGMFGRVDIPDSMAKPFAQSRPDTTAQDSRVTLNQSGQAQPASRDHIVQVQFGFQRQDHIGDYGPPQNESDQTDSGIGVDSYLDSSVTLDPLYGSMSTTPPTTLWFDSFTENLPLFATVDFKT